MSGLGPHTGPFGRHNRPLVDEGGNIEPPADQFLYALESSERLMMEDGSPVRMEAPDAQPQDQ